MALVTIELELLREGRASSEEQARTWCLRMEHGDILFFPQTPVKLPQDDLDFLRGQPRTGSSLHKNIAYKPEKDRLSGVDKNVDAAAVERLRAILRRYSSAAVEFLTGFLSPYRGQLQLDYASFRPLEERGRELPPSHRNGLLHTDAFSTRPTHGARILRFFSNIHPTRTRDWVTTEPFSVLVRQFTPEPLALPEPETRASRRLKRLARNVGLTAAIPALRWPPYDSFMLRFHDFLKENSGFQASCPKLHTQFPAGSSWLVYTETVPHAVLAGQYALEQTCLVPPHAMVDLASSPAAVLESLASGRLPQKQFDFDHAQ